MRKRVKIKAIYLVLIALPAIIFAVGLVVQRVIGQLALSNEVTEIQRQIDKLHPEQIQFGTLADQSIDLYLKNLETKIAVLQLEQTIATKYVENAAYFTEEQKSEHIRALAKVTQDLERYKLDAYYMLMASLDYQVLRKDKSFVNWYKNAVTYLAQTNYDRQKAAAQPEPNQPIRVTQGQVIGFQGCTGVCSGTHLHFVTKFDSKIIDPCTLLPLGVFSRWGDAAQCGVDKDAKISWPMFFPWIISQKFGSLSPVTRTTHEALDIIDRDYSPIRAAHDGWLYTVKRPCKGAAICNNGAANIAVVCEQKGCTQGLSTEYWHLDWMIDTGGI